MKTIKKHLAVIRHIALTSEETRKQAILSHLAAIEAEIDRPMKSAESWACYYLGLDAPPSNKQMGFQTMVGFVQRVQSDAIASKPDDVDLRKLSEETADDAVRSSSVMRFRDALVEHIYAALLKARGGV